MNLFSDVDTKQTAVNVDRLFRFKLPKLMRRCGRDLTDLSSPQLSDAPSHDGINHQETAIVNGLGIEPVIEAIHRSIYSCSKISQTILLDTYVYNYTAEQIIRLLPYERSQFYNQLKPAALNEFADWYDYWERKLDVDQEDIIDLHAYEESDFA